MRKRLARDAADSAGVGLDAGVVLPANRAEPPLLPPAVESCRNKLLPIIPLAHATRRQTRRFRGRETPSRPPIAAHRAPVAPAARPAPHSRRARRGRPTAR